MFRDHENRYLVASVGLVLVLTALVAVYETVFKTDDSATETILAIAQGVSSAVAIAVTAIALWEVLVIFAEKYKARRYEEGRKEGQRQERRAWEEWNARRLGALERGEPFDEPTPSSWEDME